MQLPDAKESFEGTLTRVRRARPLALGEPDRVWLVRSGTGEVRCSRMQEGAPAGSRRFLGWAGPGDALFALDAGGTHTQRILTLHAIDELLISVIPFAALSDHSASAELTKASLIQKWVRKLADFLPSTETAPPGETLPAEGTARLEPGQVFAPAGRATSWVRINEGSACLLGVPELRVGPSAVWIPVCRQLRFEACERMTADIGATETLDGAVSPVEGLQVIHSLCARYLDHLDLEEYRNEIDRLQRRHALHERDARAALSALRAVLDPEAAVTERESPLLTAAALVGKAMGVEIRAPAKWEELHRLTDPVDAIARASHIQHRRVLLRGAWWKSDAGPLLGFRADGGQPVALLRRRGGYQVVDPHTGARQRMGPRTAASLEPEAIMFYRPYPDRLVRPRQLVPFLLQGRGRDLMFVLALAVLTALAGMLTPAATALLMDEAIPGANTRLVSELGLALLVAATAILVFGFAQGIVGIRMSVATESSVLSGLWDRMLKLRVPFFSRFSSGDLLARASAVSEASRAINGATVQSILAGLTSLLYLGLLGFLSMRLAAIAAGLAVAAGVTTGVGAAFLRQHVKRLLELEGSVFALAVQMIRAVSKIRVAGAQRRAFSQWASAYAGQLRHVDRIQFTQDLVVVITQALPVIGVMMLFWLGAGLLVRSGGPQDPSAMTIGTFLAFQTAMTVFFLGVHALSLQLMDMLHTAARVKRTQPVLEAATEVEESRVDPGRLAGAVTLSHVDFRYITEGRKILDEVSIHVDPVEFVALVGPSGSGKSTIFRIILGFETPESGTVAFDGRELRSLDAVAVRRQLGVVLQAGRVSAGSILQNICPGGRITLDEAWEAVEDAGLAEDVRAMPMGLHTIVSEGGGNLSGGQRQRLLIARALVTRPRILLMDEATSALDNETQSVVTASLDRRKVSRVVIAHRLSTVRQASRIYVLDRGRVVEAGTYEELLREQGLFAAMMQRQIA